MMIVFYRKPHSPSLLSQQQRLARPLLHELPLISPHTRVGSPGSRARLGLNPVPPGSGFSRPSRPGGDVPRIADRGSMRGSEANSGPL